MIVPQITKLVVLGLEAQTQPRVNLKGYLLGSPTTDEFLNDNSKFIFAHRMGLISDDIYETAKESCKGNYMVVEPNNTKCVLALEQYKKCVNDLFTNCILEPKCTFAKPHQELNRRSLQGPNKNFILSPPRVNELWCRNFNYVLAYNWANDPQVREALHVRKDTRPEWLRCNLTIDYTQNVESVIYIHKFLMTKELNVLVQSGDRDMVVPFVATMEWIKRLNLTVDEEWRPWFVDGQVAGYTEKYYTNQNGYRMVFAIVKGAGHTAPEYYRRRSFQMFDRWVHWYPM
jgi:serine carboxypeptidase-like clade 1